MLVSSFGIIVFISLLNATTSQISQYCFEDVTKVFMTLSSSSLEKLKTKTVFPSRVFICFPVGLCSLRGHIPTTISAIDFFMLFVNPNFKQCNKTNHDEMLLRASFPELLTLTANLRYEWCNGYLSTILQRDVRVLLELDKIASLPDMLRLFATRTGGVLNEAVLSRATDLNHVTAKKYRVLLENLFLTLSVPAWSSNLGKRLIKSPKVYLSDLNFLSYLLNMDFEKLAIQNPPLWGQILENFVAIELSKQLTFSDVRAKLYHYRTIAGQEIDFLLEGPNGKIVAIEVKATSKASKKDFRHIETFKADIGDKFHMGFVVYQGKDIVPFGDNVFAIPMNSLWQ